MPRKRKRDGDDISEERIRKKIKKYKEKLERRRRRSESESPMSSPPRGSVSDMESPAPPPAPALEQLPTEPTDTVVEVTTQETTTSTEVINENQDVEIDIEILNLLGDAPQETKFGPPIHKDLAIRFVDIIKNGLTKEKRNEIKKIYLPPDNCKTIEAPKLNLEAQAAVNEMAVKRDKAIAAKQNQIGCALTALAVALGKLCKNKSKENVSIISNISDAARLLCDYQHQESTTRRNFILQGLEQTIRDSVKDTEADQWLFGENFSEKLKASKAIKKSGQEISVNKTKKTTQQQRKPLNTKGPVYNQYRNRPYRTGPQQTYQNYRKQPPLPPQKAYNQPPSKVPQRPLNSRN